MRVKPIVMLAALTALILCGSVQAQKWGTVKGQVVWGPEKLPPAVKAKVDKDQGHCLSKGDIFTDEYVVNAKNKGVRWVLVWLTDPESPTKEIPIHPALKAVPKKPVVIDQPCCKFEPRVSAIREGQPIEVKNSAPIPHNIHWLGAAPMNTNDLIPAGAMKSYTEAKATRLPIPYKCSIHGWMQGYLGVFKHPYFAVTDENGNFEIPQAPAGKYRLMMWQDTKGYVIINPKDPKDRGRIIEIKDDGTTDVGKIKLEPPPPPAKD